MKVPKEREKVTYLYDVPKMLSVVVEESAHYGETSPR